MSTRFYPLYQRGNPQLRIFLPNFWMKIVRSEEPLPPNMVLFQTSIEMTQYDVKNYLEKIYKVPVVEVKTTIKMGTIKPCVYSDKLTKEDDYKEALVTLPVDQKFVFPEFTNATYMKKEMEAYKKAKESFRNTRGDRQHKVPAWFKH
ncbi:hypothetical protein RUM44_007418 [Polyplax serrata]|uniref:Large ribosomal subunit protein uL23m n=1 Tax=Polyplax serrata TaxID=468196 RepID=A0ABR1B0N6_POLSC